MSVSLTDILMQEHSAVDLETLEYPDAALACDSLRTALSTLGFTIMEPMCNTDLFYVRKGAYGEVPIYIAYSKHDKGLGMKPLVFVLCPVDGNDKEFMICDQGFTGSVMKALELTWESSTSTWRINYNNMTALILGKSKVVY